VGLAREVELDDPAFDARFFVQGDPAQTRRALDAEARARMLDLLPFELFDLESEYGCAELRWGELTAGSLEYAARVLASLRATRLRPPTQP
jgi:hypothetical protein